jgi:hypothetical protein
MASHRAQEAARDLGRAPCAPCHNLIHYPKSPGAQHWVRFHADTIPNLAMLATDLDPFA